MDRFLNDVTEIYKKNGNCIVAVSEGIIQGENHRVLENGLPRFARLKKVLAK